jgi:hypothetical protein
MDIKEQIIQDISTILHDNYGYASLKVMEDILGIPDIKKALELLELKRQGKIMEVVDGGKAQFKPFFIRKDGDMREVDKNGFFI